MGVQVCFTCYPCRENCSHVFQVDVRGKLTEPESVLVSLRCRDWNRPSYPPWFANSGGTSHMPNIPARNLSRHLHKHSAYQLLRSIRPLRSCRLPKTKRIIMSNPTRPITSSPDRDVLLSYIRHRHLFLFVALFDIDRYFAWRRQRHIDTCICAFLFCELLFLDPT